MLANKVGVSESAIKKMFAKGNFSLDRLDQIFEVLDVDLLEMAENVNHQQNMITKNYHILLVFLDDHIFMIEVIDIIMMTLIILEG